MSAWKESSKLKDMKIDELNFQLGQAATQLDLARKDVSDLQQQLAASQAEVGEGHGTVGHAYGSWHDVTWGQGCA